MWLYLAMFAFHCHFVNANDILNSPLSKEYPQGKSDLVFLLDRSASVGSANFEAEKGFVESLLGQFSISPASTRVDVVSYSEDVVRHIDYIREPKNKCHFSQDIRHVTYRNSGKTNTNGALQEARNIFVGSRQDVHKVVVLLSDGQSNTGGDPTTTAEELRQDGVEIFTIAIGLFNKDELNSIATSDHHTFEYSSFREFKKLASRIRGDAHEVKWDATVSLDMCNNLCAHPSMSFGCCDIDAKCTCALIGGLHDCVCGPGYYGNAGLIGQCSVCPRGTYKNSYAPSVACTDCPEHSSTSRDGSTSISDCQCNQGFEGSPETGQPCTRKSCPKLRAPSHGKISPTVCDNVFNAVCEFSCDDGYELITDQSKSRRCLTTGEWSSSQAVCQKRQCQSLPRPTNGDKQCKNGNDNEFGTVCTFSCNPGYVLSGSIHRKCTENGQWSGTDTSCQGLTCPALRAPDNGRIYPKSCTQKKQKVKRICILQCNDGYTLNGPQLQACTIEGEWSDDGIETTCIDDAPPDIECPASITTETDPGLPSALVHWSTPVVFDNSGKEPVLTVEPAGLKSPHRFTIGSTIITYTATDAEGRHKSCRFKVIVQDNEPPRLITCPDSIKLQNIVESESPVQWEEPVFRDNSEEDMKITQSHVSGAVFVWGQHTVRYSAEDMTGNVAVCEFQVHLSPSSCPSYPAPVNGATACDDWLFGQFCSVSCNIEYEFASKPAEWYICDATGNWRTSPPALTLPWPDCSKRYVAKAAHKGMKHQYYTGNCNNPKTQQMIKEQFVNAFKLSVFGKSGGCKTVENACEISAVIVYCGAIDNTLRRRRRRDVSDLDNVVTIEFSVLVKILEPTDDEEVAEEKLNIVFDTIQDITVEFRNQTLQGQLSLDVENETLVANDDYFETEPTVPMCEDGTILSGKRCVNCPVGTYYDVISGMCSLCFPGYYQDEEAQLECKACDNGTWTDGAHAKNYTSCIDVCNPGTYSVNGLMTCKSCPIGTYQPISRQTECMPCPEGTTTWVEGANALEDCQATCSPGTYSVKGLEPCAPCPIGFYQTFRGQKYCLPCDDHLTTYGMGTVSAEYCQVVDSCSSSPCHNNGVCENHDVSYTCDCAVGYTGSNCEIDVDECQSSPCAFNSTCLDRVNGFQCVCTPGYKGQHCEVEINECLMASCLNNGQCQDEIDGYHCICVEGFTGEFCEIQPDNCASDPCQNQGLCIDHADGFVCVCRDGFDGLHCGLNVDECQSMPCLNGARCIDLEFDYECECTLGYTGQNCEVNIDDCIQHQCENGATCQDGVNTYTCRCSPTFSGRYCENKMSDDFDLLFTRPVTADVAILRDRVPLLEAFTVMFWMKTNDTSNSGTPMSYATMDGNDTESDAIVLTNYAGFNLMVNGETAYTDVALNDGTWHHVVVTWTNRGGAWRFYVDGVLASTGEHLRDSDVIFGGGVLVVGQEQDEPSGGFSPVEAYIGHISKLNIWDYVMSAESIVIISGCCYGTPGNVVAWSDFKNNIYGNVEITSPSKVCTGDSCGFENDKCHSQLCHHGGTCLDEAGYIVCVCPTGYSGLLCELETRCGSPPEIEHGNVITDNEDLLVGTIADYTCDNGYDHSGVSSLSCMNDGHWENNKVGCSDYNECLSDDSMCQHLCINSNGTYVCDCNQGYQLHSDGHTCIDINECLTDMYGLQNGGCEDTCTNTLGSYFCTCPIGYELTPNGIHCRDIDECSTGMNDCQQKCRNTLGSYTCECHPGYYLHSNGRHCQAMSCPQPLKPNHGTLVYPEFDEIQYGTMMTVNCFPGYHLIGERFRTCDMTGKWTGSDSQCIEVNCGTIGSMMENGNVVISGTGLHDTASFTCNDGFYLIGSQAMQCQEDGIWSGSRPYCGLKLT